MSATPNVLLRLRYEKWAEAYYKVRPLEEFIETRRQSKQRTIMLVSFDHVHAHRPDIHHFSRILVQYPRRNEAEPGRMVADHMVVVSARPVRAEVSFDLPVQPARPFLVMETVSPHGSIKHYETTLRVCERVLSTTAQVSSEPIDVNRFSIDT